MQDICNRLFELARPYLTVRENEKHTEISLNFAFKLLERLGGRSEIVIPAIILHDVGWSVIPQEKIISAFGPGDIDEEVRRIHEVEGAKIAWRLLQEVALNNEERLEICRIIENHDSGVHPLCLEEKIVKDADKLYRFTWEGFNMVRERFLLEPRKYCEWLYNSLEYWFFTGYGKELAVIYLRKLEKEICF